MCILNNKKEVENLIDNFLKEKSFNEIYNEASFQYEFGYYLNEQLNKNGEKVYNVDFERNISYFYKYDNIEFVKHEIDICVYKGNNINGSNECYAFELKYPSIKAKKDSNEFIANGRYPETMDDFIKDIIFMSQIKYHPQSKFKKTYCIVLEREHAEYFYRLTNRDKTNEKFPYCFYRQYNELSECLSKKNTTDNYIKYIKEIAKEDNIKIDERLSECLDKDYPIIWYPWINDDKEIGKYHIICIK